MYRRFSHLLTRLSALVVLILVSAAAQAQILVTDWGGRLTNYNPTTNMSTVINGALAQPTGMVLKADGTLFMSNIGTNTVDTFNPTSGAQTGTAITSATFGMGFEPTGLKFRSNGDLFISKQAGYPTTTPGTGGVFMYNLSAPMPPYTLTPVLTGLTQAEGLVFDAAGNLYIAELNNYVGRILKYDFVNPVSVFIANGLGGLQAATGLTIGPDGKLYVADVLGQAIRRYDLTDPTINSVFASGTGLLSPSDLTFNGGHLYVSNIGSGGGPDGFLSRFNAGTGAYEDSPVTGLFYGSSVIAVPEPSSLALVGIAAGGWYLRRRRAT